MKHLLRYLKGSYNQRLTIRPNTTYTLWAAVDAEFASYETTRQSTGSAFIFLDSTPIYWYSRLQKLVTTSTLVLFRFLVRPQVFLCFECCYSYFGVTGLVQFVFFSFTFLCHCNFCYNALFLFLLTLTLIFFVCLFFFYTVVFFLPGSLTSGTFCQRAFST